MCIRDRFLVIAAVAALVAALGPISGLIAGIGGAISGISAIAGGVSGVVAAFGAGGSLEAVGAAIAAAAGPVALVVAALLAIVGVIVYLYNTSEEFRNNINQLGQSIMDFFKPIADMIQNEIAPAIGDAFKSISEGFTGLLNDLEPLFSAIAQLAVSYTHLDVYKRQGLHPRKVHQASRTQATANVLEAVLLHHQRP